MFILIITYILFLIFIVLKFINNIFIKFKIRERFLKKIALKLINIIFKYYIKINIVKI